jgi:hypothetical protein
MDSYADSYASKYTKRVRMDSIADDFENLPEVQEYLAQFTPSKKTPPPDIWPSSLASARGMTPPSPTVSNASTELYVGEPPVCNHDPDCYIIEPPAKMVTPGPPLFIIKASPPAPKRPGLVIRKKKPERTDRAKIQAGISEQKRIEDFHKDWKIREFSTLISSMMEVSGVTKNQTQRDVDFRAAVFQAVIDFNEKGPLGPVVEDDVV